MGLCAPWLCKDKPGLRQSSRQQSSDKIRSAGNELRLWEGHLCRCGSPNWGRIPGVLCRLTSSVESPGWSAVRTGVAHRHPTSQNASDAPLSNKKRAQKTWDGAKKRWNESEIGRRKEDKGVENMRQTARQNAAGQKEMSGHQGYALKVHVSNLCGSTFQHHFPSHFISLFKCSEPRNAASTTAWPPAKEELIKMCTLGPGGWVRSAHLWNPLIAAKCLSFQAEKSVWWTFFHLIICVWTGWEVKNKVLNFLKIKSDVT